MKIEENTFHKCIHEGLDLSWCDCEDSIREELNVKLPKPPLHWCESCDDDPAEYTMIISDSVSEHNLIYVCRECVHDRVGGWLYGDQNDITGWEISRI